MIITTETSLSADPIVKRHANLPAARAHMADVLVKHGGWSIPDAAAAACDGGETLIADDGDNWTIQIGTAA